MIKCHYLLTGDSFSFWRFKRKKNCILRGFIPWRCWRYKIFTPVRGLYELVSLDSSEIIIHDPFVKFWEELDLDVINSNDQIFNFNPNLIIFSTAHSFYKDEIFMKILNSKKF